MSSKYMDVYAFARYCMKDSEFNAGGIVSNERRWLDYVGFDYAVKDGQVCSTGDDLAEFYKAMEILRTLQKKYSKA